MCKSFLKTCPDRERRGLFEAGIVHRVQRGAGAAVQAARSVGVGSAKAVADQAADWAL
jgi:hypothetical protein